MGNNKNTSSNPTINTNEKEKIKIAEVLAIK
jgi:hypothetical protein